MSLFSGDDKTFVGSCRHIVDNFHACKNQVYVIIKPQYRSFEGVVHQRKSISIGWVYNEYGRSITIPLGRYARDKTDVMTDVKALGL